MGYRIVNGRAYAVGNFFNLESESKLTNGNTGEVSFNDVLNNVKTEMKDLFYLNMLVKDSMK